MLPRSSGAGDVVATEHWPFASSQPTAVPMLLVEVCFCTLIRPVMYRLALIESRSSRRAHGPDVGWLRAKRGDARGAVPLRAPSVRCHLPSDELPRVGGVCRVLR